MTNKLISDRQFYNEAEDLLGLIGKGNFKDLLARHLKLIYLEGQLYQKELDVSNKEKQLEDMADWFSKQEGKS